MNRISVIAAAFALAFSAGVVSAQERPYIDPVLRPLLEATVRQELEQLPELGLDVAIDRMLLGGAIALDRTLPGQEPRVAVFVMLRDPGGLGELRALNVEIGSVAGNIVTARVPLGAFERLAMSDAIVMIEAARVLTVEHDSSMAAIRANRVRQLVGEEWTGATGRGVIVGVFDTGLDLQHNDFRNASGQSRVLEVWDQTISGTPPPGMSYGRYCTREQVQQAAEGNAAACPTRDFNGHGTHVAGTAAGDGSAGINAFRYPGVAPNADLIIVKGGDGSFSEDRVADGVQWLRDRAHALGRPIVINLSLGSQNGSHSGTRLLEQRVDAASGPGSIVVVAGGNSGWNYNVTPSPTGPPRLIHARGAAAPGVVREFILTVDPYTPSATTCSANATFLNLWYAREDRLRITFVRPDGSSAVANPGQVVVNASPGGRILIDNASNGPNPVELQNHAYLEISDCGGSGAPAPGDWRIRIEALAPVTGGPYDMWLMRTAIGVGGTVRGAAGFDNRLTLGSPAVARTVIAVGSFVTKQCWPAVSGPNICYVNREELGDISFDSGAGPTRDGRMKPEIAAPGKGITSARSRELVGGIDLRADPGGAHWTIEGTSMAAPHVAGAIALLLEERPALSHEDVRAVLAATANRDAFTTRTYGPHGGAPSEWWGFGKLDVERALMAVRPGAPIARIDLVPQRDTLPVGAELQMRANLFGPDDSPVFAVVTWTSTNPAVASVTSGGLVRALQVGSTQIIARTNGFADTAQIVVAPPAVLALRSASAAPDTAILAPRGTRVPLLTVRLDATGPEAVDVLLLAFDVTGADPNARVLLIRDVDGDGRISATDETIASEPASLTTAPTRVRLTPGTLRVQPGTPAHLILAVEVSGGAPNLAEFRATLVPEETRTRGVRSGALDRWELAAPPIASAPGVTTLLAPGEIFALSENPVRGNQIIFNFREQPTTAAVYTLSGARVIDLQDHLTSPTQIRWNLTNARGTRVAPGVYLAVFEVGGQTVRERLFILTPAAAAQE